MRAKGHRKPAGLGRLYSTEHGGMTTVHKKELAKTFITMQPIAK